MSYSQITEIGKIDAKVVAQIELLYEIQPDYKEQRQER